MDKLIFLVKAIFFVLLLGVFIQMFGLPSWEKFDNGGITIEYDTEFHENGLQFPALTFCPFKGTTKSAWRNGTATINEPFDVLSIECNTSSAKEMLDCIVSKTFNEHDIMHYGPSDVIVTKHFTGGPYGVCFNFLHPNPVGTNPYSDRVAINFDSGFGGNLFIHDQTFFGISINPGTFPHKKIVIEENDPQSIYFMEALAQ